MFAFLSFFVFFGEEGELIGFGYASIQNQWFLIERKLLLLRGGFEGDSRGLKAQGTDMVVNQNPYHPCHLPMIMRHLYHQGLSQSRQQLTLYILEMVQIHHIGT